MSETSSNRRSSARTLKTYDDDDDDDDDDVRLENDISTPLLRQRRRGIRDPRESHFPYSCWVFVFGIAPSINEKDILSDFQKIGKIDTYISIDRTNGRIA